MQSITKEDTLKNTLQMNESTTSYNSKLNRIRVKRGSEVPANIKQSEMPLKFAERKASTILSGRKEKAS